MLKGIRVPKKKYRLGEHSRDFRVKNGRFFFADGHWYFQTREEGCIGPYATKEKANFGLDQFIMDLLEKNLVFPLPALGSLLSHL